MSGGRVALVAEDHPTYIERVAGLLEGWGLTCVRAADGAQAIAHLDAGGAADLLVTDLDMPHKDGWQVIDAWLASGRAASAIIMVTGEADHPDVRARCAEQGIRLLHKIALRLSFELAVQETLATLAGPAAEPAP
jgi:CheY-like chemotaxis protein